jgi:hypothetical protein
LADSPRDNSYYGAPRGLLGKLFLLVFGNVTVKRRGKPR